MKLKRAKLYHRRPWPTPVGCRAVKREIFVYLSRTRLYWRLSQDKGLKSMRLFAKEVMPAFG